MNNLDFLRRPGYQRILALLIICVNRVSGRVGYSADSSKKNTEETCINADNEEYVCSVGHCCGGDGCCTYYYELWWFWLIWGVIILMSCCCAYHHRQKRRQGRNRRNNHNANSNRLPYAGVCNYPGPPLDNKVLGYCKLPVYDEIICYPPSASPPPPYSRRRSINTIACLQPNEAGVMQMNIIPCHITGSMLSVASLSHYIPQIVSQSGNPVLSTGTTSTPFQQSSSISAASSTTEEQTAPPLPKKESVENGNNGLPKKCPLTKSAPLSSQGCSQHVNRECPINYSDVSSLDGSSDEEDEMLYGIDSNNNMCGQKELLCQSKPLLPSDSPSYDLPCQETSLLSQSEIVLNLSQ